jgi:hypothetical protein
LHPGRAVSSKQEAKLYDAAFMKAVSIETAGNGFRHTGIFLLEPNIFPNWMFQPSETTSRPLGEATTRPMPMTVESGCDDPDSPSHNNSVVSRQSIGEITGTSGIQPNEFQAAFKISSQEILHIPQVERKAESCNKRRGTTAVLTHSPFKNSLTGSLNVRKQRKMTKRRLNTKLLARLKKAHNDKESQSVTYKGL